MMKPILPWIAILGFVIFLALGFLIGVGKLFIPLFPFGCLVIGIILYQQAPVLYVSFTWWMWFVGPFVRRLIDYQSGYLTPGPWILAPLLVTFVSVATFIRHLPKVHKEGSLPFVLCIAGISYSFLIGLVENRVSGRSIMVLLEWVSPILFAFHLFINWRDYPDYRRNFQRTFLWGVIVMGLYGIYQYLVAPPWDQFWLIQVENPTYGNPEPLGIRVWSTMMIPQKFATLMTAGLLLLFSGSSNLRFLAAGSGYLAFLLSLVRTGWLNWLAGLFVLLPSLKSHLQMRLIASIIVAAILIVPLSTIEPFSEVISSRIESFSSAQDDGSYQARLSSSTELLNSTLSEVIGKGLEAKLESDTRDIASYDNGFLVMLLALGWMGTIPYLLGVGLLLIIVFQHYPVSDVFASTARAIAVSTFMVQIGLNPVTKGEFAMTFWGFMGISMAACKYYISARNLHFLK
jgi:hypothetical protein